MNDSNRLIEHVKAIILGLCFVAGIICLAVVISNAVLGKPGIRGNSKFYLSMNDLHLLWIVSGKDYFVPTGPGRSIMEINPELRHLDNANESFSRNKRPGTFRIFCIGGSTTQGWPFHEVLSYPKLLRLYLRDALPGKNIEVINAGFMGSDSKSDISIINEIIRYQPDLVIAYEGRTDSNNLILRLSRFSWVLKMHAFLLRNVYAYGYLRSKTAPDVFDHAQEVKDLLEKGMVYDVNRVRRYYENNLRTIIERCRSKGCAVVLLTQVLHSTERRDGNNVAHFNPWLQEFPRTDNVALIDVDKAFQESSIPEEELIVPISVHPDYKGYALMARSICRGLSEKNIIAVSRDWEWDRVKDDRYYYKQLGLNSAFLYETYTRRLERLFARMGYTDIEKHYHGIAQKYARDANRGI